MHPLVDYIFISFLFDKFYYHNKGGGSSFLLQWDAGAENDVVSGFLA